MGIKCGSVRRTGVLAIVAAVMGYASVSQGGGVNQLAHFALARELSHGTAVVDSYHWETKDLAWYHGHYYSTKAPGLALLTTGPYFVLDRTGALRQLSRLTGASTQSIAIFLLGLIGTVLPTAVLLLVLRRVADDLVPGYGTLAAVTAGLCTLLFPFATLLFDHALSTALGFCAFALLWHARGRLRRVAAAGAVAGLAVTSEYPLALVAAALGVYALSEPEPDRIRRGAVYAGGIALGLVPLVLYNWLAFGSPFHLSYADAIVSRGVSGHDVLGQNSAGFFGVSTPQRGVALQLLFGYIGMLTITPIVIAGVAGLIPLWRAGWRREAALVGALAAAYLVYNSGYDVPFGGGTPGPRFLIPVLPFLALGVAAAYRAWPWSTLALAVPSGVLMLGVTATDPAKPGPLWSWVHRLRPESFGGAGIVPRLPLFVFVLAAVALCAATTSFPRLRTAEAMFAAFCLGAYVALALLGPRLVGHEPALLLVLFAALLAAAAAAQHRIATSKRPVANGNGEDG
jgi:hypothetical protein